MYRKEHLLQRIMNSIAASAEEWDISEASDRALWRSANYLLVPPLFLVPSFLVLFGYKFIRYTVVRILSYVCLFSPHYEKEHT
jgi:hypothetical protein